MAGLRRNHFRLTARGVEPTKALRWPSRAGTCGRRMVHLFETQRLNCDRSHKASQRRVRRARKMISDRGEPRSLLEWNPVLGPGHDL